MPGTAPAFDWRRATPDDRLPLQRMLELYQYELSDIWDQDLDAHGEFGYPLDRFWHDPACRAYVARIGGRCAGFALVDDQARVAAPAWWMDQFFVMKKYRGHGLGRAMALRAFAALPGTWEVGQMPANLAAQAFWRRVVAEASRGDFVEHRLTGGGWQGVVQRFRAPGPVAL